MNQHLLNSLLLAASVFAGAAPLWAAPTVSNVRASQRAGTNLVDVYYDLSGSGAGGARITAELSDTGGVAYGLPITSVSGKVGGGIANGRNLQLVWDAGADRPGAFSASMRLRLGATDTPPAPDGFALIPAGSFQMGDQSNPLVGYSDERPVHSVSVSAFYMGKYEVTKELWDTVRAWGLTNGYTDLPVGNGSYVSKGTNHPVHSISWYSMVKWCNARSENENLTPCYTVGGLTYKTGQSDAVVCNWSGSGYRLPTEAEWEKAARGGVSGKNFPWGTDTISHSQANYYAYSGYSYDLSGAVNNFHPTYAVGYDYSSPVGSFAPNGYGLYDMAGNVWEWCWDWSGTYSSTSQNDPRGPATGFFRVIRGGGCRNRAENARCAARNDDWPGGDALGYIPIGFRLARGSVP